MEKYTIETAAKRLEEIIVTLEGDGCDLETSIKLYEEGVKLVSYCNKALVNARQTITQLSDIEADCDAAQEE